MIPNFFKVNCDSIMIPFEKKELQTNCNSLSIMLSCQGRTDSLIQSGVLPITHRQFFVLNVDRRLELTLLNQNQTCCQLHTVNFYAFSLKTAQSIKIFIFACLRLKKFPQRFLLRTQLPPALLGADQFGKSSSFKASVFLFKRFRQNNDNGRETSAIREWK